jgi:hypothetical protein
MRTLVSPHRHLWTLEDNSTRKLEEDTIPDYPNSNPKEVFDMDP